MLLAAVGAVVLAANALILLVSLAIALLSAKDDVWSRAARSRGVK